MSDAPTNWEPIAPFDRRVLGVLIEKQKTSKSADAYPMTLNSILIGCNQKSNRDPVYELDEVEVEESLDALQRRGMVMKMTGSRVDRYRHLLYELWKVTKVEMAVVAELLLRGPQTEGDLRGRASRMEEIKTLEELREMLKSLAERKLVIYLSPPERRGSMVTHGFHEPAEFDREKTKHASGASEPEPAPPRAAAAADSKFADLHAEIVQLREAVKRQDHEIALIKVALGMVEAV